MRKLLVLLLAFAAPSLATRIVDTNIRDASQRKITTGVIKACPPGAFATGSWWVAKNCVTITIAGGAIDTTLVPGTYRAHFTTGATTEDQDWVVPNSSASLSIAQIVTSAGFPIVFSGGSVPPYLVSPQQIDPTGLSSGQHWGWNGTAYVATTGTGGGGDGVWGSITGTLSDQSDLSNALAAKAATTHGHVIADITSLQTALDLKAALSHTHAIADVTSLQSTLNGKELAANKGVALGYAPLGADGKVPFANLPASSGMTALVQDTAPQLGGALDMNGNAIQTVTPTEMARVHGVTSAIQTQLDGKSATGHLHTGVYEPIDATILRQANLAGSGSATTPAKSDHTHTGTYAPAQASVLGGGGSTVSQRITECATGSVSLTGGTWTYPGGTVAASAATSQEITIVTGLDGRLRFEHVLVSESTVFAGGSITAVKASIGRPGSTTNDELMPQTGLMVSSGNAWFSFDRPQPPIIGSANTYTLVLAIRTTGGNVSASGLAGAVAYEVCGYYMP